MTYKVERKGGEKNKRKQHTHDLHQTPHRPEPDQSGFIIQQLNYEWDHPIQLGLVRQVRCQCKEHVQRFQLGAGERTVPDVGSENRKEY